MVYQWGHSRRCPAYVRSEQTSLNSTGVTPQTSALCILRTVACQLQDVRLLPWTTGSRTTVRNGPLAAAVVRETGTSDVRAMPLKHKIMMRQQYTYISKKRREKSFVFCTLYFFHQDRLVEHSNTVFLTSGRLLERLAVTTGS